MKIAIDAGHGSQTAGKRTPDGYREHWINVMTASYMEKAAKRCGLEVVRIGWDDKKAKDDSDLSIIYRQTKVRGSGAEISVSCHANASGSGKEYNSGQGASVHIHSYKSNQMDSRSLAEHIIKYLPKGTEQKNRGIVEQNLGMCNATYMHVKAAVLVEIGFMTNKQEAALLKTEKFCKEQAEDVIKGVCEYLKIAYVKEPQRIYYRTKTNLNIRKEPKLSGELIKTVKQGEKVLYLNKKKTEDDDRLWYYCQHGSDKGWMSSKYLVKE